MQIFQNSIEQTIIETLFGLGVMSVVVLFNIYSFTVISLAYRHRMKKNKFKGVHLEICRFIFYVMLIVIAQFASLSIWVFALTFFELVADWRSALLMTAGFFTTVGNFNLGFPVGWRLIPSIIAFSGLFSFAWATASSMSMARSLSECVDKHEHI